MSEVDQETVRAVKLRAIQNALLHAHELKTRTVVALQAHGFLLGSNSSAAAPPAAVEVLRDPKSGAGLSLGLGPLFAWRTDESAADVARVTDFLFDREVAVRAAAHACLLAAGSEGLLSTRSVGAVSSVRAALLDATGEATWRRAALSLAKEIDGDLCFNIAGFLQAHALASAEWKRSYAAAILSPSLVAVEALATPPVEPDSADLQPLIDEVTSAPSVAVFLTNYARRFGFLPLKGSLAIGALLQSWSHSSPDIWVEVWNWVETENTVFARFQACRLFAENPALIPPGKNSEFWSQFILTLKAASTDPAFALRLELARHYGQYLELELPGRNSAKICAAAWRISDIAVTRLATIAAALEEFRNTDLKPAEEFSTQLWLMFHPRMEASASGLRFVTFTLRASWSLALFAAIGTRLEVLDARMLGADDKLFLARELAGHVLANYPLSDCLDPNSSCAFDTDVVQVAHEWLRVAGDAEYLKEVLDLIRRVCDRTTLVELLKKLGSGDEVGDILVARSLRARAYLQTSPPDFATQWLDSDVARSAFRTFSSEVLSLVMDALVELSIRHETDWGPYVPHFFAQAFLASDFAEAERADELFALTVLSSLATDSVSAILRLAEATPEVYGPRARDWYQRLLEIRRAAPAPVRSRLTAQLAVLGTPV